MSHHTKILSSLTRKSLQAPRTVIGLSVVLTLAGIIAALNLQVSSDLSVLMPTGSRTSGSFLEGLDDFSSMDQLLVVIRAKDGGKNDIEVDRRRIKNMALRLSEKMRESGLFREVNFRIPREQREFFEELYSTHPFHYMSDRELQAARFRLEPQQITARVSELRRMLGMSPLSVALKERVLFDPLGFREGYRSGLEHEDLAGFRFDLSNGYFFSVDGRSLMILARPVGKSQDVDFDKKLISTFDDILGELGCSGSLLNTFATSSPDGLDIMLLGPYVETVYGSEAAYGEVLPSIVLSGLGLTALFIVVYRRPVVLGLLFLPLAGGIAVTFGVTALLAGHLTVVTAGFAAVLAGLGVDFGIHMLNRIGLENSHGFAIRPAVIRAAETTGAGVFAGALTSVAIFIPIALSDFPALAEFGWIVGTGIVATFLFTMTLMPVLTSKLSTWHGAASMTPPGFGWLFANAGTVCLVGFLVTAVTAVAAVGLRFDQNIYKLGPMNETYELRRNEVLRDFHGSTNLVVVLASADDLQELLLSNDRIRNTLETLAEAGQVDSYESLSSILPARKTQRAALARVAGWDMTNAIKTMDDALSANGFNRSAFRRFFEGMERSLKGDPVMIDMETFDGTPAESILERFLVFKEGRWKSITYIYPPAGRWEDTIPEEVRRAFEDLGDDIVLTGIVPSFLEIMKETKDEFREFTGFALILVLMIALVFFRKPATAVLTVLPACIALIWTLGIMRMLGMEMNLMSMLVSPLIFGLGVDDALHLLHHASEVDDHDLSKAVREVSIPILMTSATTIIGFGSLALSDLPSLATLGTTVSIGMACCTMTSLIMLPASITAIRRFRRR